MKNQSLDNEKSLKLPIFKYKEQILQSLIDSPVVIISGLTGCGKSTQVPQFLLDAHPNSNIVVCQPRRLAATSLARRVAQQRSSKVGHQVGYQIGMESKRRQNTKLTYMTYGILIQQLLFKNQLEYDFIILDEVHERSLQMDFIFVILKKIINSKIKQNQKSKTQSPTKNVKLIIMSATLNSQQFSKYFSVHKQTKIIIQPSILIKNFSNEQKQQQTSNRRQSNRRRGNVSFEQEQNKNQVCVNYQNLHDYTPGRSILINQKSNFKVQELFLQDFLPYFQITPPKINYQQKQQIRLDERHWQWGKKLIIKAHRDIQYQIKNSSKLMNGGDILVFLPGIIQINRMKQQLLRQHLELQQKIVQVHSLFSQQLYEKLFKSKIKNKIILATNIGESSITLPNCKVVIDYCLNRKAVKDNKNGISKFTTTVASLSNLIQRKGRVGRVSDGIVYRMITYEEFQKLENFDTPQIKCVSLQMAILKTKKLQATSKSDIFQDVYQIFLNVLQPPKLESIESAITHLINQDALDYQQPSKKCNSLKKYIGKNLKITKVGQFMIAMPCDLSISKLILMGIKLGIASTIIDIAVIILSTKSFFCHEQRRANIEEFMHSIIGYDKGDNNDYLLRQRLFDHWRSRFFIPFRNNQKVKLQSEDKKTYQNPINTSIRNFDFGDQIQFDEDYKIVQRFTYRSESSEEKDFCKNRGVYANFMRELLKVSETLKIRIKLLGMDKQKLNTFQPQSELVLISLMYAFPNLICQVSLDPKKLRQNNHQQDKHKNKNRLFIPYTKGFDDKQLQCYLDPCKDYDSQERENSLMVVSHDHILKKFLLPKHYSKSNYQNCSLLYKHCKNSNIKNYYDYNVFHGFHSVLILNESVNKQIFFPPNELCSNQLQNKYLISHSLIQSKGRYMIGSNALLSHFQLVIISMIVKKDLKLLLHSSKQFYSHMRLNDKKFQIPLLLSQTQLSLINKLRQISKPKKQQQITSFKQHLDQKQLKLLSNLFQFNNVKPATQDWQDVFMQDQNRIIQQFQNLNFNDQQQQKHWFKIQDSLNKLKNKKQKNYFQRYNEWKKIILENYELDQKINGTVQSILICGHCNRKGKLVQIAPSHSFNWKFQNMKLNQYSGSWKCLQTSYENINGPGFKIYCTNSHHIGTSIDQNYCQLDLNNVNLYVPYNQIYPLYTIQNDEQFRFIIQQGKNKGLESMRHQQQKLDEYECKICYNKQTYNLVFRRDQIGYKNKNKKQQISQDPLWNQIIKHFHSDKHIRNKEKFKKSIQLKNK